LDQVRAAELTSGAFFREFPGFDGLARTYEGADDPITKAAHALSTREGDFVAVNCGALPENLVESELFGCVKGAFSGAETRPGLIRAADGGTLFLDEIADLDIASQVKFLRVLQEREVTPVGGTRPVRVDLRIIAATNQDLATRVAAGTFRKDLYGRLKAGFTISLPTLAERTDDLGHLVTTILSRSCKPSDHVRLARGFAICLWAYDWPHNIRELAGALGTALALAHGNDLLPKHLPEEIQQVVLVPRRAAQDPVDVDKIRPRLISLLKEHSGNISAVAREMRTHRQQVHRWLRRLDIDADSYRESS